MPRPLHSRQATYRKRTAGTINCFSSYISTVVQCQARQLSVSVGVSFPAYLLVALHSVHANPLSHVGDQILHLAKRPGSPHSYSPHQANKKSWVSA